MTYTDFIEGKSQLGNRRGFKPHWIPDFLFDFQKVLVEWAITQGCSALFEDCGLGKTPQSLVWGENMVRETNKPTLLLTPLAVSFQTIHEAEKFGIEATRSQDGKPGKNITVTNYQRLGHFNPDDFGAVICDESSILKSFDGETRKAVTEFMRKIKYRLLCTATAAPNDYIELGTSSEALGELGHMDMLGRFFKNLQGNAIKTRRHSKADSKALDEAAKWRFKGHAEIPFWRWVCSWSRALRKPSDLGFEDANFILPPLNEVEHWVKAETLPDGYLIPLKAVGLREQREERRRTIQERCEKVASLTHPTKQTLIWCHLNDEGDLIEELIPGCKQVSGATPDEEKEELFLAFQRGEIKDLVTKGKIAAFGMNWQNCHRVSTFPSHSFEQYYQGVRRCWRFGQKSPVTVNIVTTEGEQGVLKNLKRKSAAADKMFDNLVNEMNHALGVSRTQSFANREEIPAWL